jgi:DNA primase
MAISYNNDDSNDLSEIKERIYDEGMIEFLLEELECQHIKRIRNDRFEAQLPEYFNSPNQRAVQIKNNVYLSGAVRNWGISGDIFSIVAFILYDAKEWEEVLKHLYQVKAWVCNSLGWDEYLSGRDDFEEEVERVDRLAFLRPIQKERKQRKRKDVLGFKENMVIDESVMNRYFDYCHWSFYKDGILPETQKLFGVMFDRESERIVFPMHNADGGLIGVKGRYVGKNQRLLDEMKYLFLYRCDKSIILFNLNRALPYIKEAGEIIVFESEKSCMVAWQWGYKNTVSICGNELSPVQAMIIKQLEVDIVFAFDKDMPEEHIQKQAKQIKSRICKRIVDGDDLLDEKDSPVDKGKSIWETLYTKFKKSIKKIGK